MVAKSSAIKADLGNARRLRPGGNFLEGRKSITVGVEANYLQRWVFDLSYTGFNGAGQLNQIYDRDFYSFSVKYSF